MENTSGNLLRRRRRPRSTLKSEYGRKDKRGGGGGGTMTLELWGTGGKATAAINRRYIGSGCTGIGGWDGCPPEAREEHRLPR
jgi:hypothetical protein